MAEQPNDERNSDESSIPSLSDALAAAARTSGIARLTPGETPTAGALLGALGGIRGLVESVLPGFGFLVLYTLTHDLLISVLIPVGLALLFVVARAGTRSPMTQAIAGAVGIALTAVLALVTGKAENNFLPGILINSVVLVIFVGSIVARWPLVGVFVGILTGEGFAWRSDPAKRRALTLATWVWVVPSVIRVGLEVPLYLARNVEALAATKLLTGIPLYVGSLWVTWLLVRAVYAPREQSGVPDEAASPDAAAPSE
ncbi:DUF3159 domain-containing protein [Galbitalea soli]|uniref:DUF3159 domain-containing protein n=1 Tax=Galbitalea soli TaxID=1268042 RepID=A0A7C9TQF1_9MICO|nr:DUF3159 domain-containing protein [Galbitalea soli]NEM90263.1 DUF3159 domain-containing protein [Galbitalea soli]NYJ30971.1 hypothetical protein [Galbitalea soli]